MTGWKLGAAGFALLLISSAHAASAPAQAPMARFDSSFQERNRGQIRLSVPEVYELVNVAIALTIKARDEDWLVEKNTPYYHAVHAHFSPFSMHPFVQLLDHEMRERFDRYFELKMNAYAFEFDGAGRIVRSRVYDRTGFSKDPVNHLLPHLALLDDFSAKSGFRQFYARHRPLYDAQVGSMQAIGAAEMVAWLNRQFPSQRPYDFVNIIFSPLVSGSQSATWMEENGFSELQAHVNFPYPRPTHAGLSQQARALRRGYVTFTELNHGFINPLGDRHERAIESAISPGPNWAKPDTTAAGYGAVPFFNEMMNWGLVSLYVADRAPAEERQKLLAGVDDYMLGRGFLRFPEFSAFLVKIHHADPAASVEAHYARIIRWFAEHNDRKPS